MSCARRSKKEIEAREAAFAELLARAHAAGAEACKDIPDKGSCGWAWVHVVDGRSPFARYLLANGHRRDIFFGNYRGVKIDAHYQGQGMAGARAYAEAFASVLKEAGIVCYARELAD